MSEGDYLLGTRDDKVARLELQHRPWRFIVATPRIMVGVQPQSIIGNRF